MPICLFEKPSIGRSLCGLARVDNRLSQTDIGDMSKSLDYDVIVVGGGLGGAAAVLALAEAGLEVIALDAAPSPTGPDRFDGRAYAVAQASRAFWQAVGVWDRVVGQTQPMIDILVSDGRVSEGASPLFLHFDHREIAGGAFGEMVEDCHLRPAALAAMDAHPSITRRTGTRVIETRAEPGRTVAITSDGTEIAASLVAACDGRESPLRAAAGIRRVAWSYPQNGMVSAVAHELPHHGIAHELFLPAGPFAILPLTGNRSSLVWTERTEEARRIHALPEAEYLAELESRFGDFLGQITLEGDRWTYPLHFSLAHDYVADRLALTGDAAHAIHPIAGQGLNLGVRDAAALAEVLVEAMRQGEDIGSLAVLKRYQQWRRFDSTALAIATDGLNRLFSNDITPLRVLRDFGLAAINHLPGAKRRFMRAAAGMAGEIPKLMRGEGL
jgi:2-octaprenyl-6-methoxyphenol hydroxylase